jgi:glutathione-specific gamma-glutamylcyclotransferase
MWIFGYGSLMWDDWEKTYNGVKCKGAKLKNYRRDFNKKSVANWGTREHSCPTLGLQRTDGAECIGCAFEFADGYREQIISYLSRREGPSFDLIDVDIELNTGLNVRAVTAVNRHNHTYIGNLTVEERVRMVKDSSGKSGRCIDYIHNVHQRLIEMGIEDEHVQMIWDALH